MPFLLANITRNKNWPSCKNFQLQEFVVKICSEQVHEFQTMRVFSLSIAVLLNMPFYKMLVLVFFPTVVVLVVVVDGSCKPSFEARNPKRN